MDEELKQALEQTRREILDGVAELVRDSRTEILKAFLPYQEAANLRFRKLEADASNLNTAMVDPNHLQQ